MCGMDMYITDGEGAGGKLKTRAEDFRVEEIPLPEGDYPILPSGAFTVIEVEALNWETNHLIKELAGRHSASRNRFSFAGTKDKRAISIQRMTVHGELDEPTTTIPPTISVRRIGYATRPLRAGMLRGNRFVIRLLDADIEKGVRLVEELREKATFPNYFGVQRFGSIRPVTAEVGRAIVQGDLDEAVRLYVGKTYPDLPDEMASVRERFYTTGNTDVLSELGERHWYERVLVQALKEEKSAREALLLLPNNLLLMFIHSFQSLLFNRALTARMEDGIALDKPTPGDVVVAYKGEELDMDRRFVATEKNIKPLTRQIEKGKASLCGVVPGLDGSTDPYIASVLEAEGVVATDFSIPSIPFLTTKGTFRPLSLPVPEIECETGDDHLTLSFVLPKGTYATTVLREIMKSNDPKAY